MPAPVLADQLRTFRDVAAHLEAEGWDASSGPRRRSPAATRSPAPEPGRRAAHEPGLDVVLQVSRFPWGEDPAGWLAGIARAAEEAGFAGLALMDHLIQIPQVGSAWEQIPEPWVTLGLLAGLDTRLRLGTLVTPVTFRPPGITAKAAATLDVLTGGRAFVGRRRRLVGARARRRSASTFPPAAAARRPRGAASRRCGRCGPPAPRRTTATRVSLPETTCYPRPVGRVPVIVGGTGSAAPSGSRPGWATRSTSRRRRSTQGCATLVATAEAADPTGRGSPSWTCRPIGTDREDAWARVERLRGRTAAAAYAHAHPRGHRRTTTGTATRARRAGCVNGVLRAARADRTRGPRRGPAPCCPDGGCRNPARE